MNRIMALLTACILLAGQGATARADTSVTGVAVTFIGQMGASPGADIKAHPGVRFGMELTPQGEPKGAPIVLTAELKRPSDPEGARLTRWLIAARIGSPVVSEWEFAYDWEVDPGVWAMRISHDDTLLTETSFNVTRSESPALADQTGRDGQSGQDDPSATAGHPGTAGQPGPADGTAGAIASSTPGRASMDANPGQKAQGTKAYEGANSNGRTSSGPPSSSGAVSSPPPPPAPSNKPVASPGAKSGASAMLASPAPSTTLPATTDAVAQSNTAPAQSSVSAPDATVRSSRPSAKPGTPDNAPTSTSKRDGNTASKPAQALGGAGGRQVFALIGGSYSEQARALWMAAFFRENGIKACVRGENHGGRRLWAVVTGWSDTREEAQRVRGEQTAVVGDILIRPISAGELQQGLACR